MGVSGLALYQPSGLFPDNIGIDGSLSNIFSWTVNGDAQTDYEVFIYNNANNTSVYDSGKITSATPTHTVPVNGFSNNLELKWKVRVWHLTTYVDSDWVLFKAYTTPTVVLGATPTSVQNYTFSAIYNQIQGVSIKKYKFILYNISDVVVLDSGWQYPGTSATPTTISYAIIGMINGTTYKIECQIYNIYDMYATTGKVSFSVTYSLPDNIPQVIVTGLNSVSAIKLDWTNIKQILGTAGGSYGYEKFARDPTFIRASVAYKLDGSQVASGIPRYETGKFGQAVMLEEGTTNNAGIDPSFETGVNGFGAYGDCTETISSSTDYALFGTHSLKTICNTPGTGGYGVVAVLGSPTSFRGKTMTLSWWVRGVGTSIGKTIWANIYDDVSSSTSGQMVILSSNWQRITATKTIATTANAVYLYWLGLNALVAGDIVYADGIQFEEKAYATSFIDTTRSPETLTIPTVGVLSSTVGTIEGYVNLSRALGTIEQYLFDGGGAINKNLQIYVGTDGKLKVAYSTGTATVTIIGTHVLTAGTWYAVSWKWSASGVTLYLNGAVEASSVTAPGFIFGANATIGRSFVVTNIVTNGNFASGTTGWEAQCATLAVTNGIGSSTGNGVSYAPNIVRTSVPMSATHKFYFRYRVRVTNSACIQLNLGAYDGAGISLTGDWVDNPVNGTWYKLSTIGTTSATATYINFYCYHVYADNATANGKIMEVQQLIAIDISNLSVDQQTQAWCDANLTYFDGTTTLYPMPDGLVDDLRISSIARADADILAGYNGGVALPVDVYTTYKLNFDNITELSSFGQSIHLNSGATLTYSTTIPTDFTMTFWVKLPVGFTGVFLTYDTDFKIGYNGTKFYYENQYRKTAGQLRALPTGYFFVGIKWCEVTVIDVGHYIEIFG